MYIAVCFFPSCPKTCLQSLYKSIIAKWKENLILLKLSDLCWAKLSQTVVSTGTVGNTWVEITLVWRESGGWILIKQFLLNKQTNNKPQGNANQLFKLLLFLQLWTLSCGKIAKPPKLLEEKKIFNILNYIGNISFMNFGICMAVSNIRNYFKMCIMVRKPLNELLIFLFYNSVDVLYANISRYCCHTAITWQTFNLLHSKWSEIFMVLLETLLWSIREHSVTF